MFTLRELVAAYAAGACTGPAVADSWLWEMQVCKHEFHAYLSPQPFSLPRTGCAFAATARTSEEALIL